MRTRTKLRVEELEPRCVMDATLGHQTTWWNDDWTRAVHYQMVEDAGLVRLHVHPVDVGTAGVQPLIHDVALPMIHVADVHNVGIVYEQATGDALMSWRDEAQIQTVRWVLDQEQLEGEGQPQVVIDVFANPPGDVLGILGEGQWRYSPIMVSWYEGHEGEFVVAIPVVLNNESATHLVVYRTSADGGHRWGDEYWQVINAPEFTFDPVVL